MTRLSIATHSGVRRRLPRWQRWLSHLVAPVMLVGLVLPAFPGPALAASNAPLDDGSNAPLQQSQPPQATSPADKGFEDLSPEDLFGQPIYEVVKAEWD